MQHLHPHLPSFTRQKVKNSIRKISVGVIIPFDILSAAVTGRHNKAPTTIPIGMAIVLTFRCRECNRLISAEYCQLNKLFKKEALLLWPIYPYHQPYLPIFSMRHPSPSPSLSSSCTDLGNDRPDSLGQLLTGHLFGQERLQHGDLSRLFGSQIGTVLLRIYRSDSAPAWPASQ